MCMFSTEHLRQNVQFCWDKLKSITIYVLLTKYTLENYVKKCNSRKIGTTSNSIAFTETFLYERALLKKNCLRRLQTKAQTNLRIRTDWSAALLFPLWKVSYLNLLQEKSHFSSYVSVALETGLSLALSETRMTGLSNRGPYNVFLL